MGGQLLSLFLFSLRLLQWWYSGEHEAVVRNFTSLPVPPPPPHTLTSSQTGSSLPSDPKSCPLCHQTRRNPTVLASSGYEQNLSLSLFLSQWPASWSALYLSLSLSVSLSLGKSVFSLSLGLYFAMTVFPSTSPAMTSVQSPHHHLLNSSLSNSSSLTHLTHTLNTH